MKILLAVSGGIDSMYLANRAKDLIPSCGFGDSRNAYAVAHCNFHLRGDESDADEAFVRDWCSRHGVRIFVKSFDTQAFAAEKGISVEMAARELRYDFFREVCQKEGFDAVAVAHNANDNAETMILNLLRGTGTKGLRGMSADSVLDSVRILRPLLGTERQTIRQWMEGEGMAWREDRTNASDEFKRNKIRLKVFPIFEEINPSFVRTLCKDADRIAQADDIAREYFRDRVRRIAGDIPSGVRIDLRALLEDAHPDYLLWSILELYGFNSDTCAEVASALKSGRSLCGKKFLSDEYTATGTSNSLEIVRNGRTNAGTELKFSIIPRSSLPCLKQEADTIILDADKLGAYSVCEWREGDAMKPLGMRGKRKLSDIFSDAKLSLNDKSLVRLICAEDGRIAAAAGHRGNELFSRTSEEFKITQQTEKVLKIKICPTRTIVSRQWRCSTQ